MVDASAPGVWFNLGGKTHSMRILSVDSKLGETEIYEVMVDAEEYFPFEMAEGAEPWEIIAEATRAYVAYLTEDGVVPRPRTLKWDEQ